LLNVYLDFTNDLLGATGLKTCPKIVQHFCAVNIGAAMGGYKNKRTI
jgi:hypothetical protein